MKRILIPALGLMMVLALGGQVFSQTHLVFKGVNYSSSTLKTLPIDKDHLVRVGEAMGVEINDQPAFNNMSTHFSEIVYYGKDAGWHWHGYGVYADKDGDTILFEIWDNPSVPNGGKGKVIGATGKFAGIAGTCDYVNEYPRGWPESTDRLICRENWNFTLKNPL